MGTVFASRAEDEFVFPRTTSSQEQLSTRASVSNKEEGEDTPKIILQLLYIMGVPYLCSQTNIYIHTSLTHKHKDTRGV